MLRNQLRGWEKNHQGPAPRRHQPGMNCSILILSAAQRLPSITQPGGGRWHQPQQSAASPVPCPVTEELFCPPALPHSGTEGLMLAGCQGRGCDAGTDCGGTTAKQGIPSPKSVSGAAHHRTLVSLSQDQVDMLCPSHRGNEPTVMPAPAHHGQSGARARQRQQEGVGGRGGNPRQLWLMEVPWGHHSTAQPRISSEKQK